jgi:hypothetical protein
MANNLNNIEKRMSAGGEETPKLNMEQFIKLADREKIQADVDNEIIEILLDKYNDQKKPGESFNDWLKRTPTEELTRLNLKNGSKVVSISDYLKQKEPIKIKQLDLASQFTPGKTLESLTPSERETVNMLLKLTLGKKD